MRGRRHRAYSALSTFFARASLVALFLTSEASGLEVASHFKDPPRLALVIGIEHYPNLPSQSRKVTNALSDAEKITEILGPEKLGFNVDAVPNPGRDLLETRVSDFGKRVATVETQAIVVMYFAGHGFQQQNGHDYLVAADATIDDLGEKSIPVYWLVEQLPKERVAAAIILIDACRVDELGKPTPVGSLGPAFARRGLPVDLRVVYGFASAPNEYAASFARKGEPVSPFVAALESKLSLPGLHIERILSKVQTAVTEVIRHQTPSYVPFLRNGYLYLNPTKKCLSQHKAFLALAKAGGRSCVLYYQEQYPLSPELGDMLRYLAEAPGPQFPCKDKEYLVDAVEGCAK